MAPAEKRVQVKVEIGHQSVCRDNRTPLGFTHDWTIFVRGADGADISTFVEKVVFLLHESFPKPRRVCKEPPYKVSESGYGSFALPVEIYFRNKEEPRKCRLEYDLTLQVLGMPPLNFKKVEAMTFLNPSEEFERKLLKGGAQILSNRLICAHMTIANFIVFRDSPSGSTASKTESAKSPPSDTHKKSQSHTPHSSKPKVKDSSLSSSGTKRSSSVANEETSHKLTKKKKEKQESAGTTGVKEISILNSSTETPETVKHKTKKVKERRLSAENHGSPKNAETKHKGKEMKVKKEKDKKSHKSPEDQTKDGVKIHKFILKRTADDAWAADTKQTASGVASSLPPPPPPSSTVTSIPNNTVLSNSVTTTTKQNERVNSILAEFAGDQSTSDEEVHHNAKLQETKAKDTNAVISEHTAAAPAKSHKPKKSKIHKPHGVLNGHVENGAKKEQAKRSRTPEVPTIPQVNGTTAPTIPATNMPPVSTTPFQQQDLIEMYKKLSSIEDEDCLQKVVDIVENSGLFEINPPTFDFDLCVLDPSTLTSIKTYLDGMS